jgi:hypothetical protein
MYGGVYPILALITLASVFVSPIWWFVGCASIWIALIAIEQFIPLYQDTVYDEATV